MNSKIVCLSLVLACTLPVIGQSRRKSIATAESVPTEVADTSSGPKSREFAKIAAGAKVRKGFFNIYKNRQGNFFFEIPDSLLHRDMLLAGRVVNISDNNKMSAGQMRTNPVLISFSKRDKYIFMHQPVSDQIAENPNDPISVALQRNNMVPIVQSFEIAARNEKNDASLVDVTKYFADEVSLVWPLAGIAGGRLDTKASQIVEMKAFSQNLEIKSFYNYSGGREPFCATVNYSLVLLPEKPMQPRLADERIGYMADQKRVFSSGKPYKTVKYINRWRIEPRPADMERFQRGELVEPQKPIVIYVDTVMPAVWRKYVREGIEEWNAVFEKIGFKNVIKAKDFPKNSDFDSEDIRNTCFRYITSADANASGPSWTDPRSGEIIQGDILWWHNVIELLQTWRFVQTAAADPDARAKVLSEAIMGDAIRYAVAHETGHVLGLEHNMRGSFAYPTDSLRSPSFTQKYGTTASIMDYARNNYVAQPGDKEKGVRMTPPNMGPYDYFSIQFAYKPVFGAKRPEEELPEINRWFKEKGTNPMYLYAKMMLSPVVPDPSAQADALGNDLVKSGKYGISNLKLITRNLLKWTVAEGDDYDLLKERMEGIYKLYSRLVMLPLSNLGGEYTFAGPAGMHKETYVPVEKEKQRETIRFVIGEIANSQWLDQPQLNRLLGPQTDNLAKLQTSAISAMLGNFVLDRLVSNASLYTTNPYTISDYMKDLDTQVWSATTDANLSGFDKNIQLTYIDRMIALISPSIGKTDRSEARGMKENLWASAASAQLLNARGRVAQLIQSQPQHAGHYRLILNMIDNINK